MAIVRKYGKLLGVIVSALLLAVIYVPFQQATAFTVTVDLPDATGVNNEVTNSVAGEPFEIEIDVAAGELISVEQVTLILDNGEASVRNAVFDATGDLDNGDNDFVINNEIAISALADSGYAYGFGTVSNGATGPTGYAYTINPSDGFIAGNAGGANSPVGNSVVGLLGPGTITINGTLRTANLETGTHTLDVLINTGAGVEPDELTIDPPFEFEVVSDDSLVVEETPVTAGEDEVQVDTTDSDGDPVQVNLKFSTPAVNTGDVEVVVQNVDDFIDANSEAELEAQGFELDGDELTFTTGDDDNTFIAVGFIMDIDVSALGLPDGTEVTLSMEYDDAGLSVSEENDVRLMHQLDTGDEWEALTNDDETINDGDEVDTENNIVYGTTDDFSLFGPAVRESVDNDNDDDDDDNDRRRRNNNDGPRPPVIIRWPPSEGPVGGPPLAKILVSNSAFLNAAGLEIDEARANQQISIAGEFTNNQDEEQDYAFIVQVIDEDDVVTDISWQQGTLSSGNTAEVTTLWMPEIAGDYTIQIFVWDGIGTTPEPLSEVTIKNIEVS